MTRRRFAWVPAAVAIVLSLCAGCSPGDFQRGMMAKMVPDEDETFAMEVFVNLQNRDFEAVEAILSPDLITPDLRSNLVVVADMLNHAVPTGREMVGCNVFSSPDLRRTLITYEYEYPDQWQLVEIQMETRGTARIITRFYVLERQQSLRAEHRFSLAGKSFKHVLMLGAAIGIPLFILYALVTCARTKLRKRKWPWIVFIVLGIGELGLNWTTGEFLFKPLRINIQLFGAGLVSYGLYAPWILKVSLPLGAALFLMKRKKLMADPMEEETQDHERSSDTEHNAARQADDAPPTHP